MAVRSAESSMLGAFPTRLGLNTPEQIATEYGGNKQKIAQAAQLGVIDPTNAVLAGMFIDRMRNAQMQEQAPQQTVAQQVFAPPGAPMQQGVPGGLPAAPPQAGPMAMPPMPRPAAPAMPPPQAPMAAAGGGLLDLPVPDDMFDAGEGEFAGGGLVAFPDGGDTRMKQLMAVLNDPNTSRDAKEAARLELRALTGDYTEQEIALMQGRGRRGTDARTAVEGISGVGDFLSQPVQGTSPPDIAMGDSAAFRDTMRDNLARTGRGDYAAEVEAARQRGEGFSISLPEQNPTYAQDARAQDEARRAKMMDNFTPFRGIEYRGMSVPLGLTPATEPVERFSPTVGAIGRLHGAGMPRDNRPTDRRPTAEEIGGAMARNVQIPFRDPRMPAPEVTFGAVPTSTTPPATGGLQNLLAAAQAPAEQAPAEQAPTEQTPATPAGPRSLEDILAYLKGNEELPELPGMTAAEKAAQRKEDIGMALLSAAAAGLQSGSPTLLGTFGPAIEAGAKTAGEASKEKRAQEREDRKFAFEQFMTERGLNQQQLASALTVFNDLNAAEQAQAIREQTLALQERQTRAAEQQASRGTETDRFVRAYMEENPGSSVIDALTAVSGATNPYRSLFTLPNVTAAEQDVENATQALSVAKLGTDPTIIAEAETKLAEAQRRLALIKSNSPLSSLGGGSDSTAGGLNTYNSDPNLWSLVSRGE